MDQEYQGTDTGEVGGPGEHHQGDGGHVVNKHLAEVFSLHIKEL